MDVEGLADLLGGFALDHVGDGLASNIEELLDVQVVGSLRRDMVVSFHGQKEKDQERIEGLQG